jgi:YrbI family 3-deoxy-D-manno-octulosonate 8-phosphate phosphatase
VKDLVDLIVFDFDGVMTDNHVYLFEDGREAVRCTRADGMGCDLLRAASMEMIILSTEENPVVTARARKIKVPVHQGVKDKAAALSALLAERGIDPARVLYVGNDLNDMGALELVGWPVAPADAHPDVLAVARKVTEARGGDGVVREIADWFREARCT